MVKKKKNVFIYWILIGFILIFYNQLYTLFASFGIKEVVAFNAFLIFVVIVLAIYFTPYLDALLGGRY